MFQPLFFLIGYIVSGAEGRHGKGDADAAEEHHEDEGGKEVDGTHGHEMGVSVKFFDISDASPAFFRSPEKSYRTPKEIIVKPKSVI